MTDISMNPGDLMGGARQRRYLISILVGPEPDAGAGGINPIPPRSYDNLDDRLLDHLGEKLPPLKTLIACEVMSNHWAVEAPFAQDTFAKHLEGIIDERDNFVIVEMANLWEARGRMATTVAGCEEFTP